MTDPYDQRTEQLPLGDPPPQETDKRIPIGPLDV